MPKVSDLHRDERRAQILSAAWTCFSRKGFHGTSMAEIVRESGLSAGAVYLYFRSKEDLIAATANKAIGQARSVIAQLTITDEPVPPSRAVDRLLVNMTRLHRESDERLFRVAVEAWAEASRNETVGQTARGVYKELRTGIHRLFQRWADAGHPLAVPAGDLARAVIALVQGYIVQVASFGVSDDASFRSSLVAFLRAAENAVATPPPAG